MAATKGGGGGNGKASRFKPKVKLDPSQMQDRRGHYSGRKGTAPAEAKRTIPKGYVPVPKRKPVHNRPERHMMEGTIVRRVHNEQGGWVDATFAPRKRR